MKRNLFQILTIIIYVHHSSAKIMRNNALMTKMVSNFHKDLPPGGERAKPEVLNLMQNILCRNFPSVPCDMIKRDETLQKLIERSIQQLKFKKLALDHTTPPTGYQLTLFPTVNSEELSNYLAVHNTGYFESKEKRKKKQHAVTPKTTFWSAEPKSRKKIKTYKTKRTAVFTGRKNFRKFYPHKIKYKDKNTNTRKDFGDYSDEKLSMSVEVPDMTLTKKHQHYSYKREPEDAPVWRIDYTKHGEPSLNHFGYGEDQLKGKLIKTGPSVIVDPAVMDQAVRKDVMHPDVYIKRNVRNSPVGLNSEGSVE